ncbi:MAG: metal-dependent hydrolase [archaeon]
MPYAVTHVLTAVILVDLYRDYVDKHRHFFTMNTLFFAGFCALLPDIDIVFEIIAKLFNFTLPQILMHGGVTHTLLFNMILLVPLSMFWHDKKLRVMFLAGAFAVFSHIILDYLIFGASYDGLMLFYPLTLAHFKLHIFSWFGVANLGNALDAIILLAWLWHEERKHKISAFV